MKDPSFWERLGRGVGYGWQKAKEMGSNVADEIDGHLSLEKAEEVLEDQYRDLGKMVAQKLLESGAKTFSSKSPEVQQLLASIRKQRETVEKLREERAAEEQESSSDDDKSESAKSDGDKSETAESETAKSGDDKSDDDKSETAEGAA